MIVVELTYFVQTPLTILKKFEIATITGQFGFLSEEKLARESRNYRNVIVVEKFQFQNVFFAPQSLLLKSIVLGSL